MKTHYIPIFFTVAVAVFIMISPACGNKNNKETKTADTSGTREPGKEVTAPNNGKGIGEIKHVDLTNPLDQQMVSRGKGIYDMKCSACHKLTDERVVGPGWAGVTAKRAPEWIMNFITNTDVMLDKDPEAQKLLEQCLTRMPNQGLSLGDARDVFEFMRKNDEKSAQLTSTSKE